MAILLAIDPGVHRYAWARFLDGVFDSAWWVPCGWIPPGCNDLVIEMPQVDSRTVKALRDVLDLARVAGWLAGRTPGSPIVEYVTPQEWKGQVPKEVTRRRVLGTLSPTERASLTENLAKTPPGKRHNVYDAVGIGLWALDRRPGT